MSRLGDRAVKAEARFDRVRCGSGHLLVERSHRACGPPGHINKNLLRGRPIPDGTRWECDCGKTWRLIGSDAADIYHWEPVAP